MTTRRGGYQAPNEHPSYISRPGTVASRQNQLSSIEQPGYMSGTSHFTRRGNNTQHPALLPNPQHYPDQQTRFTQFSNPRPLSPYTTQHVEQSYANNRLDSPFQGMELSGSLHSLPANGQSARARDMMTRGMESANGQYFNGMTSGRHIPGQMPSSDYGINAYQGNFLQTTAGGNESHIQRTAQPPMMMEPNPMQRPHGFTTNSARGSTRGGGGGGAIHQSRYSMPESLRGPNMDHTSAHQMLTTNHMMNPRGGGSGNLDDIQYPSHHQQQHHQHQQQHRGNGNHMSSSMQKQLSQPQVQQNGNRRSNLSQNHMFSHPTQQLQYPPGAQADGNLQTVRPRVPCRTDSLTERKEMVKQRQLNVNEFNCHQMIPSQLPPQIQPPRGQPAPGPRIPYPMSREHNMLAPHGNSHINAAVYRQQNGYMNRHDVRERESKITIIRHNLERFVKECIEYAKICQQFMEKQWEPSIQECHDGLQNSIKQFREIDEKIVLDGNRSTMERKIYCFNEVARRAANYLKEAKKLKARMESPVSNSSTVNPQLMENEEMMLQQSPFVVGMTRQPPQQSPNHQHYQHSRQQGMLPNDASGYGLKLHERNEGMNRDMDIAPAESSSNVYPKQPKEKNCDGVIVLDGADEGNGSSKRLLESLTTNNVDVKAASATPTGAAMKEQRLLEADTLGKALLQRDNQEHNQLNNTLMKYKFVNQEAISKENGRKRESRIEIPNLNRYSRRRVELPDRASPSLDHDWESPQLQNRNAAQSLTARDEFHQEKDIIEEEDIVEEKGSNDGNKSLKNSVGDDAEVIEPTELDSLLHQLENWKEHQPWHCPEIEDVASREDGHQEWKFERTVLEKISASVESATHITESSSHKIFKPESSLYPCEEGQEVKNRTDNFPEHLEGKRIDLTQSITTTSKADCETIDCEALLQKIKAECHQLVEDSKLPGEFIYHTPTTISAWEDGIDPQEASLVLQYKDPSKVTHFSSKKYTIPTISFGRTSLSSHWLRSLFLSRVVDLEVYSVSQILQLWTEIATEAL